MIRLYSHTQAGYVSSTAFILLFFLKHKNFVMKELLWHIKMIKNKNCFSCSICWFAFVLSVFSIVTSKILSTPNRNTLVQFDFLQIYCVFYRYFDEKFNFTFLFLNQLSRYYYLLNWNTKLNSNLLIKIFATMKAFATMK